MRIINRENILKSAIYNNLQYYKIDLTRRTTKSCTTRIGIVVVNNILLEDWNLRYAESNCLVFEAEFYVSEYLISINKLAAKWTIVGHFT